MNRTLLILVWTIITYYTSLNMECLGLGAMTQLAGLIIGTSLSAFCITMFVAKERELLKLGIAASLVCLVLAGMQEPADYFRFYYNLESSLLIHKSLALLLLGTIGAIRCIRLYEQSVRLKERAESLLQIFRGMFAEE